MIDYTQRKEEYAKNLGYDSWTSYQESLGKYRSQQAFEKRGLKYVSGRLIDEVHIGNTSDTQNTCQVREDYVLLNQALETLSDTHYTIIRGIYYESKKTSDLAAELNKSPATIKGLEATALKRLREYLKNNSPII